MIALIRSEWLKLRTVRSNITMACFAVVLPLAITLLTTAFIGIDSVDDRTVSAVLLGSGSLSVLLFGIIGVLAITQEYSQGTIRLTLAANPRRTRVFVAKAIVLSILSAGLTAFIILVGNTAGEAILDSRGAIGKLSNDKMSVIINDAIFEWLPFQTGLNALLLEDSDLDFGRWGSVGYFGLWILGLSLFAHTVFKRRDA
jgi:ABC-type transport system involved in multi-copper enzyme maturation permease subunit